MVKIKILIIRNTIENYIQNTAINYAVKRANLPETIVTFIGVITNIDKISIIQYVLGLMGSYKYLAFGIWLIIFA